MAVPYTFGTATAAIPLSQLDSNFSTTITLGNTAIQLGNTVTTLNNMTLANVTISSGNVTITNVSVTTANITTANISTSIITTSETLSYGTANQVQYLNGSKVLSGSANLTFDGTTLTAAGFSGPLNGTVGATTPAAGSFTTVGASGVATFSAGSAAAPAITTTGDTNTGIWFPAADTIAFTEGGVESMRIDSSGNVGIGTSSPVTKLDVALAAVTPSNSSFHGIVVGPDSGTTSLGQAAGIGFRLRNTAGGGVGGNNLGAAVYGIQADAGANTGALAFYTRPDAASLAERMFISSGGNVGIGNTSPPTGVRVTSKAPSSSGYNYFLEQDNGLDGYLLACTSANGDLVFTRRDTSGTVNSERMRLASSGILLVGTTTVPNVGLTGQFGFSVSSTEVVISKDGSDGLIIRTTAGASNNIRFYNLNSQVGSVSTTTSATAYNTSSDYRLKNTIAPMTGALARVAALKPVTYKWNVDSSDGEGFIAHELAEVVPQCVTGEKDAVDAEGKPVYQGIDTSFLVATLTAAMQEQQALIQDLTTRLAALEAK